MGDVRGKLGTSSVLAGGVLDRMDVLFRVCNADSEDGMGVTPVAGSSEGW